MSEQARWSRINLGGSIDALYAKCAPRVSAMQTVFPDRKVPHAALKHGSCS